MSSNDTAILERLERIEAAMVHVLNRIEPRGRLRLAIAATTDDWTTSGEIWRMAVAEEAAAAATGEARPELIMAMEAAGIVSPHGLGRWLAAHEGDGIERGPVCREGVLFRVAG